MAGWISSKLKVAETFLQQIDQQAAESLGKSEGPRPLSEALRDEIPKRTDSALPLKYQLPKKSPPPLPPVGSQSHSDPDPDSRRKPLPSGSPDPAVVDDDWTELLGSPKPVSPAARPNGLSAPRKSAKKPVINISAEDRDARKGSARGPTPGRRLVGGEKVKSQSRQEPTSSAKDGEPPAPSRASFSGSSSSLERQLDDGDTVGSRLNEYHEEVGASAGWDDESPLVDDKVTTDGIGELVGVVGGEGIGQPSNESLTSSSGSGTGTDSDSTSDSEDERQRREKRRKRKERMIAEKAAAAAIEAIKERENIVARLEGEKQSLEKILEEREKQQAQEASELQTSTNETMEAVDLEKQKHNSTRMEALARLAKLESTNTELARALATTQWNLEAEVNRVAELRQQIESKELAHKEHRRRMSKIHQGAPSLSEIESSKKAELENEILDAEYSLVCDKFVKLKDKAKKLEENIVITRNEIMHPTEVEVELKKRLAQLTDHLIQKQTQVESLSSEKATLMFRIETVSRLLDENGSMTDSANESWIDQADFSERVDIEGGVWQPSNSAPRRALHERIRSGRHRIGSAVQQLDAVFAAGVLFLRRNPMAQLWSLLYLLCLHLWVMYILMSHSQQVSDGAGSGAVFSLEAINNTSGF